MSGMNNIAWLFPGQGSQSKGMLDAFAGEAVVRDTLEEASDALGWDVGALIADDPDGKLGQTQYTQPALLTASVALARLWRALGGAAAPELAGHSLGEYSALAAGGALALADAVRLVALRGEAMREAVPEGVGKMAAVLGLEDEAVERLCAEASRDAAKVWPANYNCPGQLVIAGHAVAVERAIELALAAGAKRALPLAVSVPSHTPLMQPAAERVREAMDALAWRPLEGARIWSNVDAMPREETGEIREALVSQLTSPVRWTETIRRLRRAGVTRAVEMGPGKVLAGLARRIERDMTVRTIADPDAMRAAIEALAAQD